MWMGFILQTLLIVIPISSLSQSVKTSKACYGIQSPMNPCTKHTLECSSGMIAIQDAYYTNSTACPALGLTVCGNINVSSIQDTGRHQNLNESQLTDLYKFCSTKSNCTFNGGRKSAIVAFTVVKYICINDSYNFCDQINATTSDSILLWKRNNSPVGIHTCTCTISTLQSNTILSLIALDMRLGNTRRLCPGVTISVDGHSLPLNCLQLAPYQLLVNTSQQIQVNISSRGSSFNQQVLVTLQGESNVTCSTLRSADSTVPAGVDAGVDAGGVAGGDAGGVAGGVVAALVVIGVLVAFFLWFKFKRNKEPRVKSDKPNDNYCVVTPYTTNAYSTEVTTKSRSNYDYATVQDDITSKGHVKIDNYDLATTPVQKRITQNRQAPGMDEDDYNHLDDQNKTISSGDKTNGYDTSASATAAVRRLQIMESLNKEGDHDYNHLSDTSDVKPTRSDYDTTASASRAVAQMVRNKDTAEDDYDHFDKIEAKLSNSPYNTTEECVNETDYSLARSVDKKDPYDLAK